MTSLDLENNILELVDIQDDLTRSDLQGIVTALVMKVKIEGIKDE